LPYTATTETDTFTNSMSDINLNLQSLASIVLFPACFAGYSLASTLFGSVLGASTGKWMDMAAVKRDDSPTEGSLLQLCINKYGSGKIKSPFDSCNTCECNPLGCLVCTENNCNENKGYDECVKQYGKDDFKSPFDTCNTCKCDQKGCLDCTEKDCDKDKKYQECISKYGKGEFKSPYDTCNTCSCGPNGELACTLIG
ncbi:hypothetical protein BB560_005306, partial [Smittium megazygosporum]